MEPNQKMKYSGGYIALGDSMSIDLYPRVDAQEKFGNEYIGAKIGAGSLLYQNHSKLWPEWEGLDLKSYWEMHGGYPHFHDYAEDGATTEHLLHHQIPLLPPPPGIAGGHRLFTITIGGNDLLHAALGQRRRAESLLNKAILHLYQAVIEIASKNPFATILISDVYDPTDGTGRLRVIGGEWDFRDKLPLLHHWNKEVRELVRILNQKEGRGTAWTPQVKLVETYQHFQLHGVGYGGVDAKNLFWYWAPSMIEPGAKGASELRRLWWEALEIDEAPLRKARARKLEEAHL